MKNASNIILSLNLNTRLSMVLYYIIIMILVLSIHVTVVWDILIGCCIILLSATTIIDL